MKLENLSDFILPIVILLLYFLLNMRKKKEAPDNHNEEERLPPAPLQREQARPHPMSSTPRQLPAEPRKAPLRSQIEDRKIFSAIEEGSSELISVELSKRVDMDPAYAQKKKSGRSNVQNLLKKRSLREVFLLKEILTRPYE